MCIEIVLDLWRRSARRVLTNHAFASIFVLSVGAILTGCVRNDGNGEIGNGLPSNANSQAANSNTQTAGTGPAVSPVTLPVLDAMFADEKFTDDLKTKLGLTDDQIERLQQVSRDAVLKLDESDENTSTRSAMKRADDEVKKILGAEKSMQLFEFVRQRWSGTDEEMTLNQRPNAVPNDSRIVVNAPAYRMDVFRDGQLVRTYKVGIGYPEFPLPRGLRKAEKIIFNPEWIPPDSPWVRGKYAPGKKVGAGSKDNPLGILKIPIGLPSLIHGGKDPAKLGTFASHGCVGLTDKQVEVFAQDIASLAGSHLSIEDIKRHQENRSRTEELKFPIPVPVELRYETIVVENGKVHVYRDVYELGTNSEEDLRRVLAAYDVNFDELDQTVRTALLEAIKSMAVDASGKAIDSDDPAGNKKRSSGATSVTKTIKGEKEVVVDVPQLAGKGYPAAANFMGA